MDRQGYLYLITETYFETKNPVASEPAEPMFNLQIKLFRQILIRKQKVAEREDFITKDEFFLQLELALDELKEFVLNKVLFQLDSLHFNLKSLEEYYFERDGTIKDLPSSIIEENENRIQKAIDNFNEDTVLVDLSELFSILRWKMCKNDIEIIEEIIKTIDFDIDQSQQSETEAIDLSDTKAIEKIIYLHKLGVIDFLMKKNNVSINGLAMVLSAITGAKLGTIQPMLNPIISKQAGQKNNPLNSKNTVSKVEKQLINIGFNLNETI